MRNLQFFIFITVMFTILIMFINRNYKQRSAQDGLEAGNIFALSYFIYTTIGAWDRLLVPYDAYSKIMYIYYFSVVIGYISFAFGYNVLSINNTKIKANEIENLSNIKRERKTLVMYIIGMIFMLLCFIEKDLIITMITKFGSGLSYVKYSARAERTAISGLLSALESYFIIFVLVFSFYGMFFNKKVKPLNFIPIIILGVYFLASGGRSVLLYIVLFILVFINYCYKLIPFKRVLIIFSIGMFLMIAIGHLRAANSISGMIDILTNPNNNYLFKIQSSGEFSNTAGTFLNIVEAINNHLMSFNFGYTYIVDLLVFIPVFLYPNRPLPWSEQYMKIFYPAAATGTGHGWYILNDGYMSFGILGIAIELFLFGMLLACIYKVFVRNSHSALMKCLYSVLLAYILLSIRTGVAASIKNYLIEVFPLILLYIFEKSNLNKTIKFTSL